MHPDRRAAPRIWHPDWYVLRGLAAALGDALADARLRPAGAGVLDFGCGTRPYEPWFRAAGASYRGADLDGRHEVRIAADGALEAADASYDIVASFQVLEHVWDVARYLREARRVLRHGGRLLLSTHGAWPYHPHPGDYRRWTAEGLRLEVEGQGFEMLRMWPVAGPLAWSTVFRNLGVSQLLRRVPLAGAALAAPLSAVLNAWALLEDSITPASITEHNACVYLGLFGRA